MLIGSSSEVLLIGLAGCDEFQNSLWSQNIDSLGEVHREPAIDFGNRDEPWLCRNVSLARALEDLAINVAVGMLGLQLRVSLSLSLSLEY